MKMFYTIALTLAMITAASAQTSYTLTVTNNSTRYQDYVYQKQPLLGKTPNTAIFVQPATRNNSTTTFRRK
jgi:hypothetical protein